MSVEESVYTEKKARSLSMLQKKSHFANKPCQKHLGSIHPPLLNIELTKVVVDELHLLLQVTDVLIRKPYRGAGIFLQSKYVSLTWL